ncbi:hypothetical protein LCGC14_2693940, partial [marine sediment metagenome]
MDWFYSRSCRGDNSNLCPKFVQNSEREMKMARGTSHRMWTFDEYVEEYEKLLAQLTKAEEEPKSLLAEKGMAGMGFVSKGAEKEIDSLRTQLAAHRQKTYEVSIVTFYKRDFNCDADADPPSERFVGIDFQGTGIGGGDAMLTAPSEDVNGDPMTSGLAEEYIMIKEKEI